MGASGMKNQKAKRSKSYDQTAVDLMNCCTIEIRAAYGAKRDDSQEEETKPSTEDLELPLTGG